MDPQLTLKPTNVPFSMIDLPQWVLWRTIERGGNQTKVPYQPDGTEAKSNDQNTWTTLATAIDAFERGGFDGVGFVFSPYDKFVGIDFDGCRNPETGTVSDWAAEAIRRLDSYSEVSPSGTGVKVWVVGRSPFDSGKKTAVNAEAVCDKQPGIEVYSQGRYFAVTGWRLRGMPTEPQERDLSWLKGEFWPEPEFKPSTPQVLTVTDRARRYVAAMPPAISGQGGHNQTFRVACVLVLGFGLPAEDAMVLLHEYNTRCEPPWTEKELLHKVQSACQQTGDRNYLRDAKPEHWQSIEVPQYREDTPKPLNRTTLEESAHRYLERIRTGGPKFVETGLPDVDYALGGGVERGELVIVASRPSHGKSAVALQAMHAATANGMPGLLISEEMSALAIGKRALQFISDIPVENWDHKVGDVEIQIDAHFERRASCIIVESCGTAEAAISEIRSAVQEHGVEVVVVDYAQLLRGKGKSRYEEITNASIMLRQVATECKVVLYLLCQLNREIEKRTSFLPKLGDLRDTGQLEQDADVILFLCWPHRIDSAKHDPHEFIVFVAKNRNRPIVKPVVNCLFNPSRQMLERQAHQVSENRYDEFDEWGQ